jgi:hypothetical protein
MMQQRFSREIQRSHVIAVDTCLLRYWFPTLSVYVTSLDEMHLSCDNGQSLLGVFQVPAVKRTMERFVFRVKLLTHGTDVGDSFWMGNLKHKDLKGREVPSQVGHINSTTCCISVCVL